MQTKYEQHTPIDTYASSRTKTDTYMYICMVVCMYVCMYAWMILFRKSLKAMSKDMYSLLSMQMTHTHTYMYNR